MFRQFRLATIPALLALCLVAPVQAGTHPGEASVVKEVAAATGKSAASIRQILDGAKRQQSIIDAMERPAESISWSRYRKIFITDKRINDGVAFYRKHRALIDATAAKYGVPGKYLVAILGVETSYGRVTGDYRVIDALSTLAFYYPPRSDYFRRELKVLLELPPTKLPGPVEDIKGSYAGAQGWGQFMPSSIKSYGVDADHDGHIDMMRSLPDILASVANYFSRHGWKTGQPAAVRATVTPSAKKVKVDHSKPLHAVAQWKRWGYTPVKRVDPALKATWLELDGANGPLNWLTFKNFYVITRYNHSPMYAMVVHQLAQAIGKQMGTNTTVAVADK